MSNRPEVHVILNTKITYPTLRELEQFCADARAHGAKNTTEVETRNDSLTVRL